MSTWGLYPSFRENGLDLILRDDLQDNEFGGRLRCPDQPARFYWP